MNDRNQDYPTQHIGSTIMVVMMEMFLWLAMVRDSVNKHIQASVMTKTVCKNSLEGICMNFVKVLLVYNT